MSGRSLQAVSFLIAPLFIRRKLAYSVAVGAFALAFLVLAGSILLWDIFPACFIEGQGPTPFKKVCEYVIVALLGGSILLFVRDRSRFDAKALRELIASLGLTMASEIAFTAYLSVFGTLNMAGHLLRLVATFFLYQAVIVTGLLRPFALLFRDLAESRSGLQRANSALEATVAERTEALRQELAGHQRAEEALRESEERFRTLAMSSPDAICLFELASRRIEFLNRDEFCGHPCDELTSVWSILEKVHPDDREQLEKQWRLARAGRPGTCFAAECRLRRRDGAWDWIQSRATTLAASQTDAPRHFLVTFTTITERRNAEEEARRDEARVRSLLKISQMKEASLRELLDSALEEATALSASRYGFLLSYDDRTRTLSPCAWSSQVNGSCAVSGPPGIFSRLLESGMCRGPVFQGKPVVVNDRAACSESSQDLPPGHVPVRRFISVPVFSDSRVVGVAGVAGKESEYDASDLRQLELMMESVWALAEQKKKDEKIAEQASLLDNTLDAIIVRGMDDELLSWNRGAQLLYGWTFEEARGLDIRRVIAAKDWDAYQAGMRIFLRTGAWEGEIHQKTRGGREILVHTRWSSLRDRGGKTAARMITSRDITEHRAVEAQLRRAQRLESLGTLAAGIAHDLNNVLSPILMGVEGLSMEHPDEGTATILDIMKTSVERGAAIVRQVLSFARGTEGERAEVQVRHVCREIEGIVRETFPRSIEMRIDVPANLRPVMGDATQLHQVLMNICVNARDAMPDGGRLSLSAKNVMLDEAYARMHIDARAARYVLLTVSDTGTGMTPEVMEKIFDPFFTTKSVGKGTGLGLATTLSIVKSHGGFINVYCEPGKGCSFNVYLPAAEQGAEEPREEPVEIAALGNGELILVVDDEAAVRDITRQILESWGYRVLTAGDGTEALSLYVQHRDEIRVMVTDMMMPFMDGAAAIRAVRKIDPGARIMATSGLTGEEYGRSVRDLNVAAFLPKPYAAQNLLQTLRAVLDA